MKNLFSSWKITKKKEDKEEAKHDSPGSASKVTARRNSTVKGDEPGSSLSPSKPGSASGDKLGEARPPGGDAPGEFEQSADRKQQSNLQNTQSRHKSLETGRVQVQSESLYAQSAQMSPKGTRMRRFSIDAHGTGPQDLDQNQVSPSLGMRHKADMNQTPGSVANLTAMPESAYPSGFASESIPDFGTGQRQRGRTIEDEKHGIDMLAASDRLRALALSNAQRRSVDESNKEKEAKRLSLDDGRRRDASGSPLGPEGMRRKSCEEIREVDLLKKASDASSSSPAGSVGVGGGGGGGGDDAIAAAIAASEALNKFAGRTPGKGAFDTPAAAKPAGAASGQAGAPSAAAPQKPRMDPSQWVLAKPKLDAARIMGCQPVEEHTAAMPGYSVGQVIGEGGFCEVRIAVHHISQRKVAVKVVNKAAMEDPNESKRMQREIRVMQHLSNNSAIIRLFEVIDTPKRLYMVLEHAPGGSLLDMLRKCKGMSEPDAIYVLQQIVTGLQYCHRREVVHRDIKLENILLDSRHHMKLIDFGLSAFFLPGKLLKVHCGSPSYAAPEIVARQQYEGPPVDVWSTGVVLYAMLCGSLPFHASGGNKRELCQKIMDGNYTTPDWLSTNAKHLLSRMLTVDPAKRITLEEVLKHPWLNSGPLWEPPKMSIYTVRVDPYSGTVKADEQLIRELEVSGYPRQTVLKTLLAGESNHITTSYFLLAEGKEETLQRLRGTAIKNVQGW